MTLVVAGDVKRAALRMKLEAKLGGWKLVGTESITTPLSPPAPLDARLVLVDRPGAEQTDTIIGLAGINRNDPRRASFEVATEVLGGGFTGRLMQRLREQLGYVYGVHAAMEYRHDLGAYVISGAFFAPKTVDGLKETLLMLHDLAEKEVPEEELQKAKQNMIRSLPQSFESNAGLVNAYKVVAREGLPLNWYDKWLGEIGKVTAAQARAAAKAILVENKLVVVAVGDLSVLRPGMEKLSFGPAKLYDLDGKPVK